MEPKPGSVTLVRFECGGAGNNRFWSAHLDQDENKRYHLSLMSDISEDHLKRTVTQLLAAQGQVPRFHSSRGFPKCQYFDCTEESFEGLFCVLHAWNDAPKGWWVYLVEDSSTGEVVYVGQTSQRPAKRFSNHGSFNLKEYNRIKLVACKDFPDMCCTEDGLIDFFQPRLNIKGISEATLVCDTKYDMMDIC